MDKPDPKIHGKIIRIDGEVWCLILKNAYGLGDTPNKVLRRLLGLSSEKE